jgi:hypothetical protein
VLLPAASQNGAVIVVEHARVPYGFHYGEGQLHHIQCASQTAPGGRYAEEHHHSQNGPITLGSAIEDGSGHDERVAFESVR